MITLINGCAGSGKTNKLIKYAFKVFSTGSILILTRLESVIMELRDKLEDIYFIKFNQKYNNIHEYKFANNYIILAAIGNLSLLIDKYKFVHIFADEIQDFNNNHIQSMLSLNLPIYATGDYIQTIFDDVIIDNIHPINNLKQLNINYSCINESLRCPQGHINFVNNLFNNIYETYNLPPLESTNTNIGDKPLLFAHKKLDKMQNVSELYTSIKITYDRLRSFNDDLNASDCVIISREKIDGLQGLINKDNQGILHLSIAETKSKDYKIVFFINLSDNVLPLHNNIYKPEELIDYSLLYIGLTRSKKYLFIGVECTNPSRYLSIDNTLCYCNWDEDYISNHLYRSLIPKICKNKPSFNKNYNLFSSIPNEAILSANKINSDINYVNHISKYIDITNDISISVHNNINSNIKFFQSIFLALILSPKCQINISRDMFDLIFNNHDNITYTNDIRILSLCHDYMLNKYYITNDIDLYCAAVNQIIHSDDSSTDIKDFFSSLSNSPKLIINSTFKSETFIWHIMKYYKGELSDELIWNISLYINDILSITYIQSYYLYISNIDYVNNIRLVKSYINDYIIRFNNPHINTFPHLLHSYNNILSEQSTIIGIYGECLFYNDNCLYVLSDIDDNIMCGIITYIITKVNCSEIMVINKYTGNFTIIRLINIINSHIIYKILKRYGFNKDVINLLIK